ESSLLDLCRFHLAVIRQGKTEESVIIYDLPDLYSALIKNVHGGRELAYGAHWLPVDAQQCIHHDTLQQMVQDRYSAIQHRLTYLENAIDLQDQGRGMITPALARTWLKEIREVMDE